MTSRQTDPDLMCMSPLNNVRKRGLRVLYCIQFIDIGMEDAVDEADTWTLVGILIWELDMDLPKAASEGSCSCELVVFSIW